MRIEDLRIGDIVRNKRTKFPMKVVGICEDNTVVLDFDGNEGDVWEETLDDIEFEEDDHYDNISDGYHTFKELYRYRKLYNAAFFNMLAKEGIVPVIKSKRHYTGEECFDGKYFIVMAKLPTGQISNHYRIEDWNLFKLPELDKAWKWDGHSPNDAVNRLEKFINQ